MRRVNVEGCAVNYLVRLVVVYIPSNHSNLWNNLSEWLWWLEDQPDA